MLLLSSAVAGEDPSEGREPSLKDRRWIPTFVGMTEKNLRTAVWFGRHPRKMLAGIHQKEFKNRYLINYVGHDGACSLSSPRLLTGIYPEEFKDGCPMKDVGYDDRSNGNATTNVA